ncbi:MULTISPECIES: ROK family transcriptional regulator [unclassified Rahnella]|uniref:ROK family transcriptional regulator n=1 Tax=unclassified Rahnella TaxID=2635087 RepID=UPI00101FE274|nr:ROK family transcriptional regulator [Rahnella sp. RFA10(1/100)]
MSVTGLNNLRLRQFNKQVLMTLLYREKNASKSTLARLSRLSIPAVSKILDDLQNDGLIIHSPVNLHSRGLGGGSYQIATDGSAVLCLNITPYRIESILVSRLVLPLSDYQMTEISVRTPDALLTQIEACFHQYKKSYPGLKIRLALAIHGQVNPTTGVSQRMPQAPWTGEIEIKYLLEEKLQTDILMDNDCIMLALAEKWQGINYHQDFCVINVDYGIGSSFVINQQIYRGNLFGSGQIGHTIIDPQGDRCACGRYGCLETLASLSALKKKARQLEPADPARRTPSTQELIDRYHRGESAICEQVMEGARALGLSLYNFLNILNINHIYLYGRSCGFGDAWLKTVCGQSGLNPFDRIDHVKIQATHIAPGILSREQQIMGIGYLYVEKALDAMAG